MKIYAKIIQKNVISITFLLQFFRLYAHDYSDNYTAKTTSYKQVPENKKLTQKHSFIFFYNKK